MTGEADDADGPVVSNEYCVVEAERVSCLMSYCIRLVKEGILTVTYSCLDGIPHLVVLRDRTAWNQ